MLPRAIIKHQVQHRTRIQFPTRRKSKSFFSEIEKALHTFEGLEVLEVNPLTGSILFIHRGDLETVRKLAKEKHLFDLDLSPPLPQSWIEDSFLQLDHLDTRIDKATQGAYRLPSATALTLIGLSFVQIFRKFYLPPASSLLMDAYQLLSIERIRANQRKSKS